MTTESGGDHRSSTGQALAASGWCDSHFEACRPEYEAMLLSVPLQTGWHVLDAGCGSGGYLPLLADRVGQGGQITALDLAPENLAVVHDRLAGWHLPCPLNTLQGTVTTLSLPDDHFDAVWCANVAEYLTDEEFSAALGEFRRLVRPGGLIAIKDADVSLMRLEPANANLLWHMFDAGALRGTRTTLVRGALRARSFRRWLERAGLTTVWQQTTVIERWAPLRPVERQYLADLLIFFSTIAEEAGVSPDEWRMWESVRHPESPAYVLNHPDLYWCEGQVVAVGSVPGTER